MKINDIILEANKSTGIKMLDGVVYLGDHFRDRNDERFSSNEALSRIATIIKKVNQSPVVGQLIRDIHPHQDKTFLLYDSDYFGVAVIKDLDTNQQINYTIKTVSGSLYPREGQLMFMIDDNPRKFIASDYKNFPMDIKGHMVRQWKNPNFSKKEKDEIYKAVTGKDPRKTTPNARLSKNRR